MTKDLYFMIQNMEWWEKEMTEIDLSGVVELITAFVPVIVVFALIGMIVKLLRRLGDIGS